MDRKLFLASPKEETAQSLSVAVKMLLQRVDLEYGTSRHTINASRDRVSLRCDYIGLATFMCNNKILMFVT